MPFSMSPPRPFLTAPTSEASPAISEAGIFGTTAFPLNPKRFAMMRGTFFAGAVFPAVDPVAEAVTIEQVSVFRSGKTLAKRANLIHGS
jgi:hypothetical protein